MDEMEIQDLKIRENMDKIGRKILVMSGKGGVGKTTVAINLAKALALKGAKVGILDTDLHGPNVAKMLGCENSMLTSEDGVTMIPIQVNENLSVISTSFVIEDQSAPIIWRGSMKTGVIRQFLADTAWGELDYLLIDSPPGTGDEQLTVCQAIPELTGTIIVTTPQAVAVLDARRSVSFSRKMGVAIIGLIENMSSVVCQNCKSETPIFGKGGGEAISSSMHVPLLGKIPIEIELREAEDNGLDIFKIEPKLKSVAVFDEIATIIEEGTACSTFDKGEYLNTAKCSPSACASCTSNCPSKGK